jgi:hypothetical protein
MTRIAQILLISPVFIVAVQLTVAAVVLHQPLGNLHAERHARTRTGRLSMRRCLP